MKSITLNDIEIIALKEGLYADIRHMRKKETLDPEVAASAKRLIDIAEKLLIKLEGI